MPAALTCIFKKGESAMLNLTDNERNWAKTTADRFEHKLRTVRERSA